MRNNLMDTVAQAVNSLVSALQLPDESAKANDTLGSMNFPQFSRILPYQDYDSETGLFINTKTIGFMLEARPLPGANKDIVGTLEHLLRTKIPRGVPFTINLVSSKLVGNDIEYGLREFSWSGKEAEKFNAITRAYYLRAAETRFPLPESMDLPLTLRNYRVFISCCIPRKKKSKAQIVELENQVKIIRASLGGAYIPTRVMDGAALVELMREVINPDPGEMYHKPYKLDPYQDLNYQCVEDSFDMKVIRRLLNYVRARGDMAIIYDRSCEFVKSYYDPSLDKILNPLDSRCAAWDIWRECLTLPDFDNVSNTLIPMGTKEDPFWQGSGRTIFSEGAYLMREDKDRSYEKLVDTMLSIKIDKLRAYLKNTPAANLVEEKIEKTAISIRAVLTNYVKAIRYLQGIEKNGEPFTIRDWMRGVREDQPNGWLFISSNADTHASLKPVISMWLSIAIRGLLGMGENRNRRVWIFADELPTLHKLPDLVEILPEARKFGGCYVFGIQSYAQLEDIYGVKPAATLFDVMNTRAFFRSPSKEIAEFAAGEIGEKEILKASEQYSYGADPVRDGVSTGKEKERETLVSYSDIQTLPDLSCYVTLPGPYPAVKLALKYKSRPKIAEGFILRNLDTRTDARLDTLLEAREAESSHARTLFTPDAPAPELAEKDEKVGNPPEQSQPAESSGTPATVKVPSTAKTPEADESGQSPEVSNPAALLTKVVTVPLTRPRPAAATGTAAVASATDVRATPAGGTEQALETQPAEQGQDMLPPGVNEYGEIDDMHAWDEWQSGEQTQRDMQRREEVNINHSHRRDEQDDIEIGGNF